MTRDVFEAGGLTKRIMTVWGTKHSRQRVDITVTRGEGWEMQPNREEGKLKVLTVNDEKTFRKSPPASEP
jgi:hypothetical protein